MTRASHQQDGSGADFEALDETHRQIGTHLSRLRALAERLSRTDIDSNSARREAAEIEAFFSGTSRQHHREEERHVFPSLLSSTDVDLVEKVRMLQQDHGWIEEDWRVVSAQLRALAEGTIGFEPTELRQAVDVFVDLCREHILLEESIVYPQAKAAAARLQRRRAKRSAAQAIEAGPSSS
jgi:iron-sulfur cluster repair protein YtfE (RIC family)